MADDGGLARINQRLKAIPESIQIAVRKAMEKSAQEIVDMAKTLCPVDSGKLRDSIAWTWGDAPNGSVVIAQSAATSGLAITVYAGNAVADYARWVEFGTQGSTAGQKVPTGKAGKTRKSYRTHSGTAAQPFFFPAYRLNKRKAQARMKRAATKAIKDHWGKS